MALKASSLLWPSTGLLINHLHNHNFSVFQLYQQQQNHNTTFVNLQDVTNLGLYNKDFILVTQASIVLVVFYCCHDLKEDLMGTKIFIIFVYLSNMLSTIGVKELRLCT